MTIHLFSLNHWSSNYLCSFHFSYWHFIYLCYPNFVYYFQPSPTDRNKNPSFQPLPYKVNSLSLKLLRPASIIYSISKTKTIMDIQTHNAQITLYVRTEVLALSKASIHSIHITRIPHYLRVSPPHMPDDVSKLSTIFHSVFLTIFDLSFRSFFMTLKTQYVNYIILD